MLPQVSPFCLRRVWALLGRWCVRQLSILAAEWSNIWTHLTAKCARHRWYAISSDGRTDRQQLNIQNRDPADTGEYLYCRCRGQEKISYSMRRCISLPPLRRFSKLDRSTAKRVPIPNETCSENSPRYVSNVNVFITATIQTVEIPTTENRPVRGG